MSGGYVELHAKSFYSFGLGASHTHELLAQAVEYGYGRNSSEMRGSEQLTAGDEGV